MCSNYTIIITNIAMDSYVVMTYTVTASSLLMPQWSVYVVIAVPQPASSATGRSTSRPI